MTLIIKPTPPDLATRLQQAGLELVQAFLLNTRTKEKWKHKRVVVRKLDRTPSHHTTIPSRDRGVNMYSILE